MAKKKSDSVTTNRSVERALSILMCFGRDAPQLTQAEIADRIGLNRPTVHRLVATLEGRGFLSRVAGGRKYQPGLVFLELSELAAKNMDLTRVALPFLKRLALDSGHTVHLGALDGDSIVYLEKIEHPDNPIQIRSRIGTHRPLHCTGLGKAILAQLPQAELDEILRRLDLSMHTSTTITNRDVLLREVAAIRACGYATDNGEMNALLTCAAAAVGPANGTYVAVSVTMIGVPIFSPAFEKVCQAVRQTADDIAASIGSISSG